MPATRVTRRTHTKSRGGCFECKRRKVKCDEAKPVCSGCTKREIRCEYPSPETSPRDSDVSRGSHRPDWEAQVPNPVSRSISLPGHEETSSPASIGAAASPNSSVVPKNSAQFDLQDMSLWHHFITATASTLPRPWHSELQPLVLTCDYLMHGVLATAALHLAYLIPEQQKKYQYVSAQHQDLALGPFRRAMSQITSENANHLFAFSTLLLVLNYASSRSSGILLPISEGTSLKGILNLIVCLRGCSSIVAAARSHVTAGPFGSLINNENFTEGASTTETLRPQDEDDESLEYLLKHLLNLQAVKSSTTVEEMEAYTDAVTRLRKALTASSQTIDCVLKRSFSSLWAATVSDTFIRLMGEQRPPAFIIMAHYCLLLKKTGTCWYMEHRALDLFEAVQQGLTDEWAVYVEHPRRVLKGRS